MTTQRAVQPPTAGGGLSFIEQLQAKACQLCQNPSVPYLTGKGEDRIILTRGACKMWSCPTCAARNAQRWTARILNAMNNEYADYDWYLLTLTTRGNVRGRDASLKALRAGWKRYYNRALTRWGKTPYVRVWEAHGDDEREDGRTLHLHALTTWRQDWHIHHRTGDPVYRKSRDGRKRKLRAKDVAYDCGLGHQADVRPVDNAGQVAGYIAKYLTKTLNEPDLYPDGARRIEVSRGWPQLPDVASEYTWAVHQTREGQDRTIALAPEYQGIPVLDLRPNERDVDRALDLSLI